MDKAYWATHNLAGYKETQVVVFDDDDPEQRGLIESGYFREIKDPPRGDEGTDRA